MIESPLVLSDESLTNPKYLHRDFSFIKTADQTFGLRLNPEPFKQKAAISFSARVLVSPYPNMGMQELMYRAIPKELTTEERNLINEDGMADDRREAAVWRTFGHPKIADLLDEYYNLADAIKIEIFDRETDPYPEIANEEEIEGRVQALYAQAEPLVQSACLSTEEMVATICREFGLKLRPRDAFNQYWVSRIIEAPGFALFEPKRDDQSWFLANEPYGWLTKRHGAALQKHGYNYKFGFWEQEIGNARGHLWIQTDRGPLRLTDSTDAVSLRSNFPVQVSTVAGEALFELLEIDVPDHLMRDGPNIPPELSPQTSNQAKQQTRCSFETFWRWLSVLFRPQS